MRLLQSGCPESGLVRALKGLQLTVMPEPFRYAVHGLANPGAVLGQERLTDDLAFIGCSQGRSPVEVDVSKTQSEFGGGPTKLSSRQAGDPGLFQQAIAELGRADDAASLQRLPVGGKVRKEVEPPLRLRHGTAEVPQASGSRRPQCLQGAPGSGEIVVDIRPSLVRPDRSVLNLPGVGKSLTFRVIGITRYGRRVLEFDHDRTRAHSPIIEKMGKVVVLESKSVGEYLRQLDGMGENTEEYAGIYGYSMGQTEGRMPLFEYPSFDFSVTEELSNLDIEGVEAQT